MVNDHVAANRYILTILLQEIRYDRPLESIEQIDNVMTKLIKSNFNNKIAKILQ